ncbi:MAG: hypothetical protein A2Z71_09650 [Chloroflexi bacterium RBG_13_50_21]|nr:MAG: hypothetical protein A2Z71_09650 [Chloroflexi bacterium RBG_13_50_21]
MHAEFNPQKGSIFIHLTGISGAGILEGIPWVSYRMESGKLQRANLADHGGSIHEEAITDVHGTGSQLVIRQPVNPQGIELTYRINTYAKQPFTLLQIAVRNQSRKPIYLEEFQLFEATPAAGGRVGFPERIGELRFFKVGWHGWDFTGLRRRGDRNTNTRLEAITRVSYGNPATPPIHTRGEFWSEGWGVLADENSALVAGCISTDRQFGQVHSHLRPGQEGLTLSTQADGILLEQGESCESEWGYMQLVLLPNPEPASDFVNALAREMQARVADTPPPPMWTHWYHFFHDISEELFLQNLDVLADKCSILPFQVVELDDGYQSAWGDWTTTNPKFPHGLEWLADQISSRGFTPGLWLAPFQVIAKSTVAREHPEWLVKGKHGKPIHAGFQYNLFTRALDATHPAVLEHLRQLTDKISHQWGYRMLKLDFLNAGALPGRRYNPKLTRAEALRMGLEAIRQGAGGETFLLGSGCPFGPGIGIMDSMRIGPDTAPSWEPYFHWIPWAGPLIKQEPSMPSLRNALRHTLNLDVLHQRLWWNDPDCLLVRDVDTRLTEPEVMSAVTLVGLSGGMLASSDDLHKVSPERLNWVGLLVPNLGLKGTPSGLLEQEMPGRYMVKLKAAAGSWQVVGLFNWNNVSAECYIKFEEFGFPVDARVYVFDFWRRKAWRTNNNNMVFPDVPAHGCKLLRVCVVVQEPQLVGDTLHISQGGEIASWQVKGESLLIETVDMGRQVVGELWLALERAPGMVACNGEAVNVEHIGEGIYALQLRFFGKGRVEVGL